MIEPDKNEAYAALKAESPEDVEVLDRWCADYRPPTGVTHNRVWIKPIEPIRLGPGFCLCVDFAVPAEREAVAKVAIVRITPNFMDVALVRLARLIAHEAVIRG